MRLHLLSAALCALAFVASPPAARAAAPTVEDFAQLPAISNVVLSPSGRRLAMIVADGRDGRRALAVMDLPPKAPPRIVASYGDADVGEAQWVNEDRLVYQAFEPGAVIREGGGGAFAVDHDGNNRLTLIAATMAGGPAAGSRIASRTLTFDWRPLGRAPGGNGNEILVQQGYWTAKGQARPGRMARLDTVTGQLTPYTVGAPSGSHSWIFDASGEPRVSRVTEKGRDKLFLRKPGTTEWESLSDVDEDSASGMSPLALESDHELVVYTRAGGDTYGLYVLDLKTRKLQAEPIIKVARYDIKATGTDGQGQRLSWASLDADRPTKVWFSEHMASLQKSLDASLPAGRINEIRCTQCDRSAYYLVHSYSDQHPGEYLIYDPAARKLLPLGPAYPHIDPATQGRRTFHWIKARDGLPLSLVVTHPPGSDAKTPLPTVVLVHGGPWIDGDTVAWEAEPQFLASRGWRVIQPNFRGSTGYGMRHWRASFKQWGQTMQDDLSDALKWAVGEGLSDPQRACIYSTAAAMAATRR
jgi:dipeptidyl aminopeptidase/acylaminoacyl peptidase